MQKIKISDKFSFTLYTPKELKEHLDLYVIGQDKAKEVLSVAIYNHYKRLIHNCGTEETPPEVFIDKSNCCLLGPSGSGKTFMIKTIAEFMGVPYYIADATSITQAGYVGDDVETIITGTLISAGYNIEAAECSIIFIDEIDKLARRASSQHISRDVVGEGVQQALLKMVEGNVVGVPPFGGRKHPEQALIYVDTTNILFIGSGAFSGIEEITKKRLSINNKIGFIYTDDINHDTDDIYDYVSQEDLRKFGLIPEFVGRFPIIVSIKALKKEDLIRIIKEPKNSILKQYQTLFELDDIKFNIEDAAMDYIAEIAVKLKTGARSLRTIFEDIMVDYMFKLPGTETSEFTITINDVKEKLGKRYQNISSK